MTAKQDLLAHLEAQHADHAHRGNHNQLVLRHREHHRRHLTHSHRPEGWTTGSEQIQVNISLSPPKNPSASRNGDRNWTLHIAHVSEGHGWRWELAGTRSGDSEGAINEANKTLGWLADWEPIGWGFQVMGEVKA